MDNIENLTQQTPIIVWLRKNWFLGFLVIYGLWVWLPFLAPVLMQWGWTGLGNFIYFFYSFFCHQLPDRSYYFFGSQLNYSLSEIQAVWMDTINLSLIRRFIGSTEMGWKVAWSDRMISFYNGIWLFSLIWYPFRRKIKGLPLWGLILFLLPMAIDGGTHFISDLAGIGQGFRSSNQWLAIITNQALPATFYAGNALGSFNSTLRIITGLLAAWGIIWFAFPLIDATILE